MKILFLHYGRIYKEGFSRTFKIAKEIAKLGHQVVFITNQDKSKKRFPFYVQYCESVKIISFYEILPVRFSRTGFAFLSTFVKLIYLLKHHRYDIIHSDNGHRPSTGIPGFFLKYFFRIPHITEWWDYFESHFVEKSIFKKMTHGLYDLVFQKPILRKANGLIVLSSFLRLKALESRIPEYKLIIVQGGSDTDLIPFIPDNKQIKKENGINPSTLVFGFIGMMKDELKDLITFIEAFNNLKYTINIKWFTTGWLLPKDIKNTLNIGNELLEFGWQNYNQYVKTIACADIFILTQREIPRNLARWPNKIGDYFSAGRPILINPYGEINDLVRDYPQAFIQTEIDTPSIMETIKNIYINKEKFSKQRTFIRNIAEDKLSWKHKALQCISFYKSIIEN